ncbi:MAG: SDR family NAD(P)-dependent oxidoreductase, partial [Actinomycetota bacterium]|nr:SDR family NAD(P)-dependent oxidoreductase [Actinomycetota bacterium]
MDDGPSGRRLSRLSRSVVDHRVLVTGAGSGIGRATAHLVADEGATVAITDRDGDRVDEVVAEIEGAGGRAAGWELDVTDRQAVDRVVAEAADRFGGLDVLVNNAGLAAGALID